MEILEVMSEQNRASFLGNLGENIVAWLLRSKYGIQTAIVKGKGIDLLCIDKEGNLFPKNQHIAISVKTRARSEAKNLENVISDWSKINEASKVWHALPYFAYVRICPEKGCITLFLVEVSEVEQWGKTFNVTKAEESSKAIFQMNFSPYPFLVDWENTK